MERREAVREDRDGPWTPEGDRDGVTRANRRATFMSDETQASDDEQLVLRDIRALLDQLQLDRDHTLTMQSKLDRRPRRRQPRPRRAVRPVRAHL